MIVLGWPLANFLDFLPDLKSRPLKRHNFERLSQQMESNDTSLKTS